MKKFICLAIAAVLVLTTRAQSNAPVSVAERSALTRISSDTGDIDLKTKVTIYRGNVHVDDPEMKMTCDLMTVRAPEGGGPIESIVAEGKVVLDMRDESGQMKHATGAKLVYTYKVENSVTNDTAQLTGEPKVEEGDYVMSGEIITWNRTTGHIDIMRPLILSRFGLVRGTNQAPAMTNPPPATTGTTNP